jgi:hypothetical protein
MAVSEEEWLKYVKEKAEKGGWIKINGGYVQASALLDQITYQRNLEAAERVSRERMKTWRREQQEAKRNEELIKKGLHPIYSRVPGVKDFKIEDGIVYERYYLSGGSWTNWKPVKKIPAGVEYYTLPGKGIFTLPEVMAMAQIGTLSARDLLNLPGNVVAEIVKRGYKNLMGMNPDLWKQLKETYAPEDLHLLMEKVKDENTNLQNLLQEVMEYLHKKQQAGDITAEDRELLNELAKRLLNPRGLLEFFGIKDAHLYAHNLAGTQSASPEHQGLWGWIQNAANWVQGAANSFDQWIASTLNVKQPVDYLTDGINKLLTALGLQPLKSQDREYLEDIAHIAGIATYSELVTSIIGTIIGWKLAGMAAGAAEKVLPETLGYLGATEIPKAINPLLIKGAGALFGGMAGTQIGESISWMALSVHNQAQSMIKALDQQESIAKDRTYEQVRSKLIAVGDYLDLIKSSMYAKDWNTMASAVSEAKGILNEAKGYMQAHAEELKSIGVYDELEALINNYVSMIDGFVAVANSKGTHLPALLTAANSARATAIAAGNAADLKENNPYIDWSDLSIVAQYLNWLDAVNHGRLVTAAASNVIDKATLGTGKGIVSTLPMSHSDRVELVRHVSRTKGKETHEMKTKYRKTYVAPTTDYSYYKALMSDWHAMGLYSKPLAILPDWVKSVVTMSYKFYQDGKRRGYWLPYELLGLIVLMLLTGMDLRGLMYLFDKYGGR